LIPAVMALRLKHFENTKDATGCRATAELWEKLNRTDAPSLHTAARMRAVTASVIRANDASAGAAQDVINEADRAVAWLRQAVAAGFADAAGLKKDRAFNVLGDRADFTTLVSELEEKAKSRGPRPLAERVK
jgi:hypothetical protein